MPSAPSTADVFGAIAEPRRRRVLDLLKVDRHGRDVSSLVTELRWPQPQVSKHLGVLRKVGLVNVERRGRSRVYTVNGGALRPVYDWLKHFEEHWDHQLTRIKQRAETGAIPKNPAPHQKD